MKIEIKITKEVLRRSMWCGVEKRTNAWTHCGIAVAIRDLLPQAEVFNSEIEVFKELAASIPLPKIASDFIDEFDSLIDEPEKRLNLPEFSFEIDVPDEVIERIGINEAKAILEKSETLNLIEG
jgi:hypothetical protein